MLEHAGVRGGVTAADGGFRQVTGGGGPADRVESRSMARDGARAVCALCNHELWTEGWMLVRVIHHGE